MRSAFAAASFVLALTLLPAAAAAQEPQRITGALEDGDSATGDDNRRYDDHRLTLEAGKRYRISLNSEAFDPVARLYRGTAEGDPVAENDDSNESLNSRIVHAPAESGAFAFRVSGFSADARGAYQIEVAELPPLPEPAALFHRTEMAPWRVYFGDIAPSDPESEGKRFDDYRISFAAGQTRLIWLDSTAFDPMVQIFRLEDREGSAIASDDDSGGGLNAMLAFHADEAGDYVIRVTTFDDSERGAYRLRVSE